MKLEECVKHECCGATNVRRTNADGECCAATNVRRTNVLCTNLFEECYASVFGDTLD